ncbi:MAG TPA: glycosyltransferase family 4 protein [Tepidisphaeraceae bacterium]|jgi:glycosyltransferase involved in cell wall biosynthesis|nr:glycosyltransferase family 4 protein [Tepidisphaeraceae bacterium]
MNFPLRILFVNQYYWPDRAPTAQSLADLAEFLANRGHEVHIVCSAGQYDSTSSHGEALSSFEVHKGVLVRRIGATSFGRDGKLGNLSQLVDFASFHALCAVHVLSSARKFDVVVTLTTPPLIAIYASVAARLFRTVRHVHWTMNLHPDIGIEMGLLRRTGLLARVLSGLTDWQLRTSAACVSLGDCMTNRLRAKRVSASRISRIPMWGLDLPDGDEEDDFRTEWDLEGRFVVMHAGNAGAICTFDVVREAAVRMRSDDRFVFMFVGAGRQIRELRAFAESHDLTNVRFRPYVPREQLARVLRTGDVHLVSLRAELTGTSVPSKLYGIMAARRPAIFIGAPDSESAAAIRRYSCGKVVSPTDPDAFEAAVRQFAMDPVLRASAGSRGREGYEREFNPTICCTSWATLIESIGTPPDKGRRSTRAKCRAGRASSGSQWLAISAQQRAF